MVIQRPPAIGNHSSRERRTQFRNSVPVTYATDLQFGHWREVDEPAVAPVHQLADYYASRTATSVFFAQIVAFNQTRRLVAHDRTMENKFSAV